jgi:prophage antirepressor-like protein
VAADAYKILDLDRSALRRLDKREVTMLRRTQLGMPAGRDAAVISEGGLYQLIMQARRTNPAVVEFQNWVTVLPAIRKDGAYIKDEEKVVTGELSEDKFVLRAFTILQKKVERLSTPSLRLDLTAFPARTNEIRAGWL